MFKHQVGVKDQAGYVILQHDQRHCEYPTVWLVITGPLAAIVIQRMNIIAQLALKKADGIGAVDRQEAGFGQFTAPVRIDFPTHRFPIPDLELANHIMQLRNYLQGANNMSFWQNPSMSSHHQNRPPSIDKSAVQRELPVAGAGIEKPDAERLDDSNKTRPKEIGGREGPEPTRFGDWEKAGRCIDF